jgi:hypothetical protein
MKITIEFYFLIGQSNLKLSKLILQQKIFEQKQLSGQI